MTSAIILCAGKSTRLQSELRGLPKWMIDAKGLPLLQHMVNGLHKAGVFRTVVLRSHFKDKIKTPSVLYRDDVATTNMLATVMSAQDELRGDLIICYGDIMCESRLIEIAVSSKADVGVVLDRKWINLFRHRSDDPIASAESCFYDGDRLIDIGQKIQDVHNIPLAQFVGLVRLSAKGVDLWINVYRELASKYSGRPWRNAKIFEQAYTTDFLQELIDRGHAVTPIVISGGWLEFDTPRDLKILHDIAQIEKKEIFDFHDLDLFPSVVSAGGVALRSFAGSTQALLVGSGESGEWRIPKGMLMPGEEVKTAAEREFKEETGVSSTVLEYLSTAEWDYEYAHTNWHERCVFFLMLVDQDCKPIPDTEHAVAEWVDVSMPDKVMMYPAEYEVIKLAINRSIEQK